MFIIQSNKPQYCGHTFASSSCHTEYDGKVEAALQHKTSLGGLSRGLRRTGSNLSELSLTTICDADATQIELNFLVKCKQQQEQSVFVRVETPCGEVGIMEFSETLEGQEQVFRPAQHGCGNGTWKVDVYQLIDNRRTTTMGGGVPKSSSEHPRSIRDVPVR
ncbi:hypothetical protein Q1695_003240 [Nippostrongylus brasiliensis]|nr:hypothetical protein Q1695_003240 [Nippostrongylus brasiliensis]